MQSNANGVEKVRFKDAFNQDAEHYAKEHKVLYSEALRRLIVQYSLDQVLPHDDENIYTGVRRCAFKRLL